MGQPGILNFSPPVRSVSCRAAAGTSSLPMSRSIPTGGSNPPGSMWLRLRPEPVAAMNRMPP